MIDQYDAVLLTGFGGPEEPADVMPFLRNVTRGRGIPDERLTEVAHHYDALGGRSPINEQTRALQEALQGELDRRGLGLPVLWGNRNWAPFLADAVAEASQRGLHRLLAVTTSAYSSYSSCRQYREDLAGAQAALPETLEPVAIDKVRAYFDQPGFLAPMIDATVAAVEAALAQGFSLPDIQLVGTTHSIPDPMADTSGSATRGEHGDGGAYVTQHRAGLLVIAEAVAAACGRVDVRLAYQSRSGPPSMPWLEPDINDVLADLAAAGKRAVVVIPLGFISDHVEVVWDLDREAAETAAGLGLWFHRVLTPGVDPRFVAALADLVQERQGGFSASPGVTGLPARPDFCAPGCCVNLRGVKPTVAGQDSADDALRAVAAPVGAAVRS